MRRDIEHALVGTQQTAVAGDASTARQLAGCQAQISAATTDDNTGTPRDFAEAQLLAIGQATYDLGGDPDQLLVTTAHSILVANLAYEGAGTALGRARQDMGESTTIVNVVETYISPFGQYSIVIDKWLNAADMLLLQTDAWTIPELRPMGQTPLAKTGDTDKTLINCEMTLRHLNQNASGQITDLN